MSRLLYWCFKHANVKSIYTNTKTHMDNKDAYEGLIY